jgi:hypothetical protein
MNKYITTDTIDTTAQFYDPSNNPVDPSTITFTYRASNHPPTTVTYAGSSTPGSGYIFRNATGSYEFYLDTTTLVGYAVWYWAGFGARQVVGPSSAIVYPLP